MTTGRTRTGPEGSLELHEDMEFQRKSWRAERIGWIAMTAVVVLAGLGFFGRGLLARAERSVPGGSFALRYDRFSRYQSPTLLEVRSRPTAGGLSFWIDRSFLDAVEIESIQPEPDQKMPEKDRIVFRYWDRGGEELRVQLRLSPEKLLLLGGRAGLERGPEVRFRQFVFP